MPPPHLHLQAKPNALSTAMPQEGTLLRPVITPMVVATDPTAATPSHPVVPVGVIGHGVGGKVIPAKLARLAESQLLE